MTLDPPVDTAVFDLDGVIIDSRAPVRAAINVALKGCGFPPRDPADLDRFIGPPLLGAFSELTGEAVDSETVVECAAAYRREYARVYLDLTTIVPGIPDALRALNLPLGLATAKQARFVAPLLERFGLGGRFAAVCGAEEAEPKAAIVARALERLGGSSPVLVGDTVFDIEAARGNAIRVIGVAWGIGTRAELSRAGADVIVDRPDELQALLASGYGA